MVIDEQRSIEEVSVAKKEDQQADTETVGKEAGVQAEKIETQAPVPEEGLEREDLERLQQELEQARARADEYLDGWQRAQAEFSNYKKRQDSDRAQMISRANASLLRKLLPVVDDFERAMSTLPSSLSEMTWCEGVFLIKHKLDAVLESEGVEPIETAGQMFDPCFHEAVTYEEVAGYEDGQIIGEVQRGYILGERVLRPALVRVAKAPPEPQPEEGVEAPGCKDKE